MRVQYRVWTKGGDLQHGAAYHSLAPEDGFPMFEFERYDDDQEVYIATTDHPEAFERMLDSDTTVTSYKYVTERELTSN